MGISYLAIINKGFPLISLLLELLGIPIRIGQNRNQPVFASWYDDVGLILKKGEEGRGA